MLTRLGVWSFSGLGFGASGLGVFKGFGVSRGFFARLIQMASAWDSCSMEWQK